MAISLSFDSSEILMPSTLSAWSAMMSRRCPSPPDGRHAPIAGERRVEHLAEPVDDHRLAHLRQDAVIDARIVVRSAGGAGQRPARHQDDAAAQRLDRLDLLLIGADHVVDRDVGPGREVVGAGAAGDQRVGPALGRVERTADQLAAPSASRAPCRAARCPSPRRRRGRGPRDSGGRRWSCPSRSPHRARDRCRRADRRRHGPPNRRCG